MFAYCNNCPSSNYDPNGHRAVAQPGGGKKEKSGVLVADCPESRQNMYQLSGVMKRVMGCGFPLNGFGDLIKEYGGTGTYSVVITKDAIFSPGIDKVGLGLSAGGTFFSAIGVIGSIPTGGASLILPIGSLVVSTASFGWSFGAKESSPIPSNSKMRLYAVEINWQYTAPCGIIHREQERINIYYDISADGTETLYIDDGYCQSVYPS